MIAVLLFPFCSCYCCCIIVFCITAMNIVGDYTLKQCFVT